MQGIRRIVMLGVVGVLSLLLAPRSMAQTCLTCHDFNGNCNGYTQSQIDCNAKTNCSCGRSAPKFADAMHPGIITRQEGTFLVVTEVFPDSPAADAGVMPGDRIILVNGRIPVLQQCSVNQWSSTTDPHSSVMTVVRGSVRKELIVKLVPVRQILAAGWSSRSGQARTVAFNGSQDREYGGLENTYLLGIKWRKTSKGVEVTDILIGSPADQIGLTIGDTIQIINGIDTRNSDSASLAGLLSSDAPVKLRLAVLRSDNSVRNVELYSAGISSVFHNASAQSGRRPSDQIAGSF